MMTPSPGATGPTSATRKAWIIGAVLGCLALGAIFAGAAVIVGAVLMRQPDDEVTAEPSSAEETASTGEDGRTTSSPRAPQPAANRTFAVGDRVEIEASNHWVPCVVTENEPPSVMRVRCDAYPALSRDAGEYVVDRDNPSAVRHATGDIGEIEAPPAPTRRVPAPAGLKVGEYACYGSGGRAMAGLAFRVLPGNRYEDLDGEERGTFVVSGTAVTFRGGHLDGERGRDLRGHSFTIGSQAECEPF